MTKAEIINGHYTCTCDKIYTSRKMIDPSCILHDAGPEIELIMDEWAKIQGVAFIEWAYNEQWQPYDAYDRWINTDQGNIVLSTPALYYSFFLAKLKQQ